VKILAIFYAKLPNSYWGSGLFCLFFMRLLLRGYAFFKKLTTKSSNNFLRSKIKFEETRIQNFYYVSVLTFAFSNFGWSTLILLLCVNGYAKKRFLLQQDMIF
jgi:hypothetical protein